MKILVVDDEKELTDMLADYLSDLEHDVDIALNGRDGLDLLKTHHYDLIFTDHNMPEIPGLEIAKYVKEKKLDTKVILMTGYPVMTEFFAKALGSHEYLTKPFSFHVIDALLKKYRKP